MIFQQLFDLKDRTIYGAVHMPYTFCIMLDKILDVYSASWKNTERPGKTNFIGDNIHQEVGLPHFRTMEEAKIACEQELERLVKEGD